MYYIMFLKKTSKDNPRQAPDPFHPVSTQMRATGRRDSIPTSTETLAKQVNLGIYDGWDPIDIRVTFQMDSS